MPTHGSLTKAGKVRNQTPKVVSDTNKKTTGPRRKNNQKYKKMLKNDQNPFGRGRRRRRRRR